MKYTNNFTKIFTFVVIFLLLVIPLCQCPFLLLVFRAGQQHYLSPSSVSGTTSKFNLFMLYISLSPLLLDVWPIAHQFYFLHIPSKNINVQKRYSYISSQSCSKPMLPNAWYLPHRWYSSVYCFWMIPHFWNFWVFFDIDGNDIFDYGIYFEWTIWEFTIK